MCCSVLHVLANNSGAIAIGLEGGLSSFSNAAAAAAAAAVAVEVTPEASDAALADGSSSRVLLLPLLVL